MDVFYEKEMENDRRCLCDCHFIRRMQSKESEAPTPSSTQDVPAETAETEYQPEPVETHEGEVRSFYTGEWMDEKSKESSGCRHDRKHARNPSAVWNRKCGYYL